MDVSNNTVVITGGATGIGFALAKAFLDAGSRVVICGRREHRLDEARKALPGLAAKVCDVADERSRAEFVEWVVAAHPAVNVLVNNAGVQRDVDFSKGIADFASGENEIRINLEATIVLAGLFVPHLTGKKGAAIVNVSSGLGFVPAVKMPVYSATKAGVHAFSMALREQLAPVGIRVFEVIPPAVDTDLNPQGRAKRGGFKPNVTATAFAAAVVKGLSVDVPEITYGMSDGFVRASRDELDARFREMNRHM
jgi:uncharacterized oxidoreductase